MTATIAAKARIDPTERSMPEVRMTNVIPAASTTLIEACCMTMDRFCHDANRSVSSWNTTHNRISTGSMPRVRSPALSPARTN